MKTIEELQNQLRDMIDELEMIKQFQNNAEKINFKSISSKASRYPIKPHILIKSDEHKKRQYIVLLLTIANFEPLKISESLYLIHRIAYGIGYINKGEDLQAEYILAQTLSFEQLDESTALFADTNESLMLILECLLVASEFNAAKTKAIKYIAQLAMMLKISKCELNFLSRTALVIITTDPQRYELESALDTDIFDCYLMQLSDKFTEYCKLVIPDIPANKKSGSVITNYKFKSATITTNPSNIIFECDYVYVYGSGRFKETKQYSIKQPYEGEVALYNKVIDSFIECNNKLLIDPIGITYNHPLINKAMAKKLYKKMCN